MSPNFTALNPSPRSTGYTRSTVEVEVVAAAAEERPEACLDPAREEVVRMKVYPPRLPVEVAGAAVMAWCSNHLEGKGAKGKGVGIDEIIIVTDGMMIGEERRRIDVMMIDGDRGRKVRAIGIGKGTTGIEIVIEIETGKEDTVEAIERGIETIAKDGSFGT